MRARLTVALIAPLLVLVACSTSGAQPAATSLARGPQAPVAGQPPEDAAQTDGEFGLYVVQPGDYLTQIAEQLDVSLEQLTALNGIADPTLILVGQVLRYPLSVSSDLSPDAPAEGSEAESPASGAAVLPGLPVGEEGAEQPSGEATTSGGASPPGIAPTENTSATASGSAAVAAGGGSMLSRLPLPWGAQLGDAGPFARLAAIVALSAVVLAGLLLGAERLAVHAVPPAAEWVWARIG